MRGQSGPLATTLAWLEGVAFEMGGDMVAFVLPICCANALRASNSNLKLFYLPEHNRMSHSLSSPIQNAEALLSASSSIAADRSSAVTGDESSREIRQVLSELLSGNTVIPSKNRVK